MTEGPGVRGKRQRRALLKLAAIAGGAAAIARAPGSARAAPGSPLILGTSNDAGTASTALNASGSATLIVSNAQAYGIGVRASRTGYGLWGEGNNEGVHGMGGVGVSGVADESGGVGVSGTVPGSPPAGRGVRGYSGSRYGLAPGNVGVHGYSAGGAGVVGEGGGGTGVQGFGYQSDLAPARAGVGVRGVGGIIGVLAQSGDGVGLQAEATGSGAAIRTIGDVAIAGALSVSGDVSVSSDINASGRISVTAGDVALDVRSTSSGSTALRVAAPSGGRAIEAHGLVTIGGHIEAEGTIAGRGGDIGVLATSGRGGIALRAIAPDDGSAIRATGPVTVEGALHAFGLAGDGSGLTGLRADALAAGTLPVGRLPAAVARRDAPNTFYQGSIFLGPVALRGPLRAQAAGYVTIDAGRTRADVALPGGVTMGPAPAILLTPRSDPRGIDFYAVRLSDTRFRVILSRALHIRLAFSYLVVN